MNSTNSLANAAIVQPITSEVLPFPVFGAPICLSIHRFGRTIFATGVEASRSGVLVSVDDAQGVSERELQSNLGLPMSCVVSANQQLLDVEGMVQGVCGRLLLLAFTNTPIPRPRRDHVRYACGLPVVFRAAHGTGKHSAWREGTAMDLSMAGMGLCVVAKVRFPAQAEIQLSLPPRDSGDISRVAAAESDTREIVKLTGRARHGRYTSDGDTRIGIHFDWVGPAARLKLGCFLEHLALDMLIDERAAV
jgi:hypothetical protein